MSKDPRMPRLRPAIKQSAACMRNNHSQCFMMSCGCGCHINPAETEEFKQWQQSKQRSIDERVARALGHK